MNPVSNEQVYDYNTRRLEYLFKNMLIAPNPYRQGKKINHFKKPKKIVQSKPTKSVIRDLKISDYRLFSE